MTGAELSKELTKRGRDIAACDVFIDNQGRKKSIAEVIYDEDNNYILLIPEAKSRTYGKKAKRRNYEY